MTLRRQGAMGTRETRTMRGAAQCVPATEASF
jgi:hypothetical protein